MSDAYNSTTKTTTPGYGNPGAAPYAGATHTTHIRETRESTNWFAWLLGGAVVAVGIAALVYGGSGTSTQTQPGATGNNVTIEAPATAPAADAPAAPLAPEAPTAITPEATAPAADAPAADAPAVADPVAPAPEAAPAAPTGN
ncbi:hypothetical protein [Pseudotabrizicola algicola]|uniref:Uncharacterized protein n=1 Tax=Pseudotabrizicola algicola TaxID=2709381 RepID=A0A6B3RJR2_9RHOB|nr:hypothetical protein [Pseudotabrizicola algicola]NEX45383.1 hypothetical protein [Pseudotabrizicola algicola]